MRMMTGILEHITQRSAVEIHVRGLVLAVVPAIVSIVVLVNANIVVLVYARAWIR